MHDYFIFYKNLTGSAIFFSQWQPQPHTLDLLTLVILNPCLAILIMHSCLRNNALQDQTKAYLAHNSFAWMLANQYLWVVYRPLLPALIKRIKVFADKDTELIIQEMFCLQMVLVAIPNTARYGWCKIWSVMAAEDPREFLIFSYSQLKAATYIQILIWRMHSWIYRKLTHRTI